MKIFKGNKFDLKYRRNNMTIFRSCPSTNDISESIIGSSKYQKRRTPMADWQTIEATTILQRNDTIDYLKEIKEKQPQDFNQIINVLSQKTDKQLIEEKKKNKTQLKQVKAKIIQDKVEHQKKLNQKHDNDRKNAMNTTLLTNVNELNELFKKVEYKAKTKRIYYLKNQLKCYKYKYSNLDIAEFPNIQFSVKGKLLNEEELTTMLKKCMETISNHNNNNNNASDNENDITNVNVGKKRMREYLVNNPKSKRPRFVQLPNID